MTEGWFACNAYCISCFSEHLSPTKPNTIAHDFVCRECDQIYELKSSSFPERKRVLDGAYATMIRKIKEDRSPSLMLLQYERVSSDLNASWTMKRLVAIPPAFLTESIIESRNPLRSTARRAGWQGCIIRLDRVPADGRIELISNSEAVDRVLVRRQFASAQRLTEVDVRLRGWTALVLGIVRRLGTTFTLRQVYAERRIVEEAFPNNRNIEAKLRQQLQILRDLGFIGFSARGTYTVLNT